MSDSAASMAFVVNTPSPLASPPAPQSQSRSTGTALPARPLATLALPSLSPSFIPANNNQTTTAPAVSTMPTLAPLPFSFAPSPPPAATPKSKVLIWFRSDLRLHDHAALAAAMDEASSVLPLYTFDPRHFGTSELGFQKTGRQRAQFILDSVTALRASLRSLGSDLVVRHGIEPEVAIPELAEKAGCNVVYYHREATFEDQEVESKLEKALETRGIECKAFWGGSLYHIDDLPFEVERMPDVYTEFRTMVEEEVEIRDPLAAPDSIPALPKCEPGKIPTMAQLGMKGSPAVAGGSNVVHGGVSDGSRIAGGEQEALRRLSDYLQKTASSGMAGGNYEGSSAFLGAEFSCQISPWLALGCISARKIYQELSKSVSKVNKTTTYFELVWRDFFKFVTWKYASQRLEKKQSSGAATAKTSKVNYIAASR